MRNIFPTSSAQRFLAHSPPLGLQHLYAGSEVNTFLKVTAVTFITSFCHFAQTGPARPARGTHSPTPGRAAAAAQLTHRPAAAPSGRLRLIPSRDMDFTYFQSTRLFSLSQRAEPPQAGLPQPGAASARTTPARGRPAPPGRGGGFSRGHPRPAPPPAARRCRAGRAPPPGPFAPPPHLEVRVGADHVRRGPGQVDPLTVNQQRHRGERPGPGQENGGGGGSALPPRGPRRAGPGRASPRRAGRWEAAAAGGGRGSGGAREPGLGGAGRGGLWGRGRRPKRGRRHRQKTCPVMSAPNDLTTVALQESPPPATAGLS